MDECAALAAGRPRLEGVVGGSYNVSDRSCPEINRGGADGTRVGHHEHADGTCDSLHRPAA